MKSISGLVVGFPFTMKTALSFIFAWKSGGGWLRLGWRPGFGLGVGAVFIFPCLFFGMKTGRMFAILGCLICGWMRRADAGGSIGIFTMEIACGLGMGFAFNMKSMGGLVADFLFTMESANGLAASVVFTFHTF